MGEDGQRTREVQVDLLEEGEQVHRQPLLPGLNEIIVGLVGLPLPEHKEVSQTELLANDSYGTARHMTELHSHIPIGRLTKV